MCSEDECVQSRDDSVQHLVILHFGIGVQICSVQKVFILDSLLLDHVNDRAGKELRNPEVVPCSDQRSVLLLQCSAHPLILSVHY